MADTKATSWRERVLYEDAWRTTAASALAFFLGWAASMVWHLLVDPVTAGTPLHEQVTRVGLLTFVLIWGFMGLTYPALTWWAYGRQTSDEFHERLGQDTSQLSSWAYRTFIRQGPWSEAVIGFALATLVMVGTVQGLSSFTLSTALVIGLLVIAASWVMLVVNYALIYARMNVKSPGAEPVVFDGDEPPTYSDYVSFSTFLSTSSAPAGAQIRTRAARRSARAQSLVAFVFNTVIVALLVSFLAAAVMG